MLIILLKVFLAAAIMVSTVTHARADRIADLQARAEAGDPDAQYDLAFLYDNGYGVPRDYDSALQWYRKAAEQGHAVSQWNLGFMYANGVGMPRDDAAAVPWYRKAADQGHVTAQYELGMLYASGRGTPQDDVEAFILINQAADQAAKLAVYKGDRDSFNAAKAKQIKYAETRDVLAAKMTPDELTRAAEHGVPLAQTNLGIRYGLGDGVTQDDTEAVRWYHKAAEQGDPRAQYFLGLHYFKGQGIEQSDREAVRWYRRAAKQGYGDAQHRLGLMFTWGRGITQDFVEAHLWISLAMAQASGEDKTRNIEIRDALVEEMTPEQLEEAEKLAREWKPTGS